MGKVILPLSEGELADTTIFDRRFVIECCETFHLHWRNLRLELSADNWIQLVEAFETGIAKWRAHGSPRSHPHLELARFLMDTSEVIHPNTANAELCENLYKTLRETHGADAEFWVEDAFVHFHYRDLRVEMPIADFLAFSKTMAAAHTKLRSHTYRPLEDIFRQLDEENIIYVVLRNWEALPESVAVGPHSDLDLLVHPAHVEKVDRLWRGNARTPRTSASSARCPSWARPASRATSWSTSARPTTATCPRTGVTASSPGACRTRCSTSLRRATTSCRCSTTWLRTRA